MKSSSYISKSHTKIIGLARFTVSCRNKEAWVMISPASGKHTQLLSGSILEKGGLPSCLW